MIMVISNPDNQKALPVFFPYQRKTRPSQKAFNQNLQKNRVYVLSKKSHSKHTSSVSSIWKDILRNLFLPCPLQWSCFPSCDLLPNPVLRKVAGKEENSISSRMGETKREENCLKERVKTSRARRVSAHRAILEVSRHPDRSRRAHESPILRMPENHNTWQDWQNKGTDHVCGNR